MTAVLDLKAAVFSVLGLTDGEGGSGTEGRGDPAFQRMRQRHAAMLRAEAIRRRN
jgi:hypothetical protein